MILKNLAQTDFSGIRKLASSFRQCRRIMHTFQIIWDNGLPANSLHQKKGTLFAQTIKLWGFLIREIQRSGFLELTKNRLRRLFAKEKNSYRYHLCIINWQT